MPQPTFTDVHVNAPLTNLSIATLQSDADFISARVFPVIPVPKASDIYFTYDRGIWLSDQARIRDDGTPSAGGGYTLSQSTYSCEVYAYHQDVGPRVIENADTPLAPLTDATMFVTQKLAIARERQFVTKFFTTGVWTGTTTGTDITPSTKWDASTGATPIKDIETQQFNIRKLTAKWPNRLVLGTNVYQALKNQDDFLQRIKYTERGVITPDVMAAVLAPPNQVEAADGGAFEVIVASSVYNSAAEGASDAITWTATDTDALLAYAAPNPGIRTQSAGYIFTWVPVAGYEARIRNIPQPELGFTSTGNPAQRVEGEMSFDMHVVTSDCGAYFSAATS